MDDLTKEIFNEFVQWYSTLVEQHGRIPRAVSGVSGSGNQFIFIMDGLRLDHVERNKLITYALEAEGASIFAYGSLMAVYNEDTDQISEELSIYAGTSKDFIAGSWFVTRNKKGVPRIQHKNTSVGDDPQNYPTTWFLTPSKALSRDDKTRFSEIWNTLRKNVQIRKRY